MMDNSYADCFQALNYGINLDFFYYKMINIFGKFNTSDSDATQNHKKN